MKEINVPDKKCEGLGKKVSKQLKRKDYMPCNTCGAVQAGGKPETLIFAASMSELCKVVYTPHIYAVDLNIDGESHTVILKELQFHPVTDALLHVDFYAVNDQGPTTTDISVKLVGLVQGVHDGERISLSVHKVSATAPYQRTPEYLGIDVASLKIGKSIRVSQLNFEGLEMATSKDVVVRSVKVTRAANLSTGEKTEEKGEAAAEGEGEDEAVPAEV